MSAITLPPLHTLAGVGNAHRVGPAPSDEFPEATFTTMTANHTPDTQHVLLVAPVPSHAQGGSGVATTISQQPPDAPPPKKSLMKLCPIPKPVKTMPKATATDEIKKHGRQLHQTPKPTGDSQVPPDVQCALDITELINRKAGVVVIFNNEDVSDDTSFADVILPDDPVVVDGSNDEDANPHPVKVVKETLKPDKCKGRVDPPAASLSKASYVVAYLAHPAPQLACQLDPVETAAKEDACALCQYQAGEINNLCMQLNQQQTDNQRLWDELQTQLHMMKMMNIIMGGCQPEMPQIRGSAFDFRSDRSSASSTSGIFTSSHFGSSIFDFQSDVPIASSSSSGALSNPPTSPMDAHIPLRCQNELQYDALEAGDREPVSNWKPIQQDISED
ncbi:hypothetical protein M422DRAFT_51453 [Sphaerobolus stellatus SS14]|uniref:Uncharacterized protein n=1 Tax=Sphaerobolus stellatus (strain SS14) TaxID=990650 RepID=A0A0C9UL09_SPHS4|nr:hypothetical protein M422DRAFT_51453 [Sphaerobolus stellatus SS14]